MTRKSTGTKFTPQEFKKLNYCVECGKVLDIKHGGKCKECLDNNLVPCEICEVLLRKGIFNYYSYDIRENKREDVIPYVSKQLVREFLEIKKVNNKFSDTLCKDCQDWESKVKDICWKCDNDFNNSRENYKLNGNMCPECVTQFQ